MWILVCTISWYYSSGQTETTAQYNKENMTVLIHKAKDEDVRRDYLWIDIGGEWNLIKVLNGGELSK